MEAEPDGRSSDKLHERIGTEVTERICRGPARATDEATIAIEDVGIVPRRQRRGSRIRERPREVKLDDHIFRGGMNYKFW